jgi:hypothetical protein
VLFSGPLGFESTASRICPRRSRAPICRRSRPPTPIAISSGRSARRRDLIRAWVSRRSRRHHTICTKSYGNRVRWPPRPLRYEVDEGVERKIPMICHLGPARCATDRFYNPLILPKLRLSVRFCTNRAVTPSCRRNLRPVQQRVLVRRRVFRCFFGRGHVRLDRSRCSGV